MPARCVVNSKLLFMSNAACCVEMLCWIPNEMTNLCLLQVDQGTLFELILAANYLDIKVTSVLRYNRHVRSLLSYQGLLDVTCKTVANMIKGKTPEEIRKTFNIKNDFTQAEEEQVRKENEWCEEK